MSAATAQESSCRLSGELTPCGERGGGIVIQCLEQEDFNQVLELSCDSSVLSCGDFGDLEVVVSDVVGDDFEISFGVQSLFPPRGTNDVNSCELIGELETDPRGSDGFYRLFQSIANRHLHLVCPSSINNAQCSPCLGESATVKGRAISVKESVTFLVTQMDC